MDGESAEDKEGLRWAWRGETGSRSDAGSWFQKWARRGILKRDVCDSQTRGGAERANVIMKMINPFTADPVKALHFAILV